MTQEKKYHIIGGAMLFGMILWFFGIPFYYIVFDRPEPEVVGERIELNLDNIELAKSKSSELTSEELLEKLHDEIIVEVNNVRTKYNLNILKENNKLNLSAKDKALVIKDFGEMDHHPFGITLEYFPEKYYYNYKYFGENLALDYYSASSVVDGWMNSTKGHREILLSDKFVDIGVGMDVVKKYKLIIVLHMGKEKNN